MKKKLIYILSIILLLFCLNIVVPVKADSGWDSSYDSSSSSDIDGDLDPLSFVIGITILITIAVIYTVYEKIKNKIIPKKSTYEIEESKEEKAIAIIKQYDKEIDINNLKLELCDIFKKVLINIENNNQNELKQFMNANITYDILLKLKDLAKYKITEIKIVKAQMKKELIIHCHISLINNDNYAICIVSFKKSNNGYILNELFDVKRNGNNSINNDVQKQISESISFIENYAIEKIHNYDSTIDIDNLKLKLKELLIKAIIAVKNDNQSELKKLVNNNNLNDILLLKLKEIVNYKIYDIKILEFSNIDNKIIIKCSIYLSNNEKNTFTLVVYEKENDNFIISEM